MDGSVDFIAGSENIDCFLAIVAKTGFETLVQPIGRGPYFDEII